MPQLKNWKIQSLPINAPMIPRVVIPIPCLSTLCFGTGLFGAIDGLEVRFLSAITVKDVALSYGTQATYLNKNSQD